MRALCALHRAAVENTEIKKVSPKSSLFLFIRLFERYYSAVLLLNGNVVECRAELLSDLAEIDFVELFLLRLFLSCQTDGLFLFGKLVYALQ